MCGEEYGARRVVVFPPPETSETGFSRSSAALFNRPKSETSDFGWRVREGHAKDFMVTPLPTPSPLAGEGADRVRHAHRCHFTRASSRPALHDFRPVLLPCATYGHGAGAKVYNRRHSPPLTLGLS